MKRSIWASALAAAALTACSGAQMTPAVSPGTTADESSAAPDSTGATASVTFLVVVPGGTGPSLRFGRLARAPRYISPSTQSVVVKLNKKNLVTIDTSAASPACKAGKSGARTCSAKATVATGERLFTIDAYDGAGGSGNILASGDVSEKVSGNRAQVRVSLTGRPASIALSVQPPYPPAGKAQSFPVTVAVLDADGNTIVGAYPKSVTLADSDKTGATHLSPVSLKNSKTRVKIAYDGSPLTQATLAASSAGLARAKALFAPSPTVVAQYDAPQVKVSKGRKLPAGLYDICIGPDGNVWGTDSGSGAIAKITPDGKFTTYPIPGTEPLGISVGSDGNLWFAEQLAGAIGKITTAGKITSYPISVPASGSSQPAWTTLGPDGRTWFVDQGSNNVTAGTIAPDGTITKYPLPANSYPVEIVAGPDGNLWITDSGLNAILVLSTSGKVIAVHHLPTRDATPWGIAVGPDKNVWFAEFSANLIGRMTTKGKVKEFAPPTALSGPINVASGPDGNVWFAESGGGVGVFGKVGYVTPDGSAIRDFPIPKSGSHVHGLVFDSKGSLWFTEFSGPYSALGKLIY